MTKEAFEFINQQFQYACEYMVMTDIVSLRNDKRIKFTDENIVENIENFKEEFIKEYIRRANIKI